MINLEESQRGGGWLLTGIKMGSTEDLRSLRKPGGRYWILLASGLRDSSTVSGLVFLYKSSGRRLIRGIGQGKEKTSTIMGGRKKGVCLPVVYGKGMRQSSHRSNWA